MLWYFFEIIVSFISTTALTRVCGWKYGLILYIILFPIPFVMFPYKFVYEYKTHEIIGADYFRNNLQISSWWDFFWIHLGIVAIVVGSMMRVGLRKR